MVASEMKHIKAVSVNPVRTVVTRSKLQRKGKNTKHVVKIPRVITQAYVK